MTARFALRALRIPHRVDFGVRRDGAGRLNAHAWVLAGTTVVTGGTGADYTRVGSFHWPAR